ncbi:hypothetical protein BO221_29710 [Archangium sp. Cb G35]|uniref:hypothetical protein n=1 Tax=Archangium sp. Cb G35 TaxID=1920190 RepID=UPI0009357E4F|nr:hypothetical protein [Archangium sp. Cb G35]OJT21055.1 hypothetical protein BO221_29710 [Archangium sp. Cb G35]
MAVSQKTHPDPRRVAFGAVLVGLCSVITCVALRSGGDAAPVAVPQAAPARAPTAADVLGVGPDFTPQYTFLSMDRVDIAGAPRLVVRVQVPRGLTREELEGNVRHALLRFYEAGPVKFGAVSVGAFTTTKTNLGYDAAKGDFAPGGEWSAADPGVPLSNWLAKVDVEERYFQERKALPTGTRATLVKSELSDTVSMSRSADRWGAEDILAELKPGAPVVVVGSQDLGAAGTAYEVETTSKPKRRGWVLAGDLKTE